MVKSWIKSKTLWCNALGLLLFVLQQVGITPTVLPPQEQTVVMIILNFVLRFITKQPIVGK